MQTQTQKMFNGLDTTRMFETIDAVKNQPSLGAFQFRAKNRWIEGGINESTIKEFYGAGAEDMTRTRSFVFLNGEPQVLLGKDEGANPVEYLLHALAGCVTTTFILHATARGMEIESINTHVEGDLDIRKLIAVDESLPAGYQAIRMRMDIRAANATDEEVDALLAYVKDHSPVCTTVCNPVPVTVERARLGA